MKRIITFCMVATVAFACKDKHENNGPIYGDRAEVATIEDAQNAINQGSSEIIIENALTEDAELVIPKLHADGAALSIEVLGGGNNLTFTQGTGSGNYPDLNLYIADVNNLLINLPDMSVVFDGAVDGALTSSTAASTLTLTATSQVNTLNVLKGHVRNFGTVTNFGAIATTSSILWPVATAAELRVRMTETPYDHITNGGVVFTTDISGVIEPNTAIDGTPAINGIQANQDAFRLGAAPTEPQPEVPYDGYIIDGNGYTLNGSAYNNVLAIYANSVTVQDITIFQSSAMKSRKRVKNNVLENTTDNGISIYGVLDANLMDVTVRNCGKFGIVVNGSTATATGLTTSGNEWGGVDVADGSLMTSHRPGFTLVSGSIAEERAIVAQVNSDVTVPAGWTRSEIDEGFLYTPPAQ